MVMHPVLAFGSVRPKTETTTVHNFITALRKCKKKKDLYHAKSVHLQIQEIGIEADPTLGNLLVTTFVSCGGIPDAQRVFESLCDRFEDSWTSLIEGYAAVGLPEQVFDLFSAMQSDGLPRHRFAYLGALRACVTMQCLQRGHNVHSVIVAKGLDKNIFIGNSLIDMYSKCGSLVEAKYVFYKIPERNVVSWNALLTGYARQMLYYEALDCIEQMQLEGISHDAVTFICVIKACADQLTAETSQLFYTGIIKKGYDTDLFVSSMLLDLHVKSGLLLEAQVVFDKIPNQDVVSWTTIIKGYVDWDHGEEALACFDMMQVKGLSPNAVTLCCSLKACTYMRYVERGRTIHIQVVLKGFDVDLYLSNGLIDMYARFGLFLEANYLFSKLLTKSIISWGALISGYAEHGLGEDALLQLEMMELTGLFPDLSAVTSGLKACCSSRNILKGYELHFLISKDSFEDDPIIGGALVDMYCKCGMMDEAFNVFEELPARCDAVWTALIAGCAEHDMGEEALSCFWRMYADSVTPDVVTYVSSLKCCASLGALENGQKQHSNVIKVGLETDLVIGNAMVDFYGKCSLLEEAQYIFDSLSNKSIVSWTALVAGYASKGDIKCVICMFDEMCETGVEPNETTFLALLTVCSHAGITNKGYEYFDAMYREYNFTPCLIHYNCLMDMLSRTGRVIEAVLVLENMPLKPDLVTCKTLLSASWRTGNTDLGRYVFDFALHLDVRHAVLYTLMFNIYADAHLWVEAQAILTMRNDIKLWEEICI